MIDQPQPDPVAVKERLIDLDLAIQAYVAEATAAPASVVVDWSICVERADENGGRLFLTYFSPTMTAWKLSGFAEWSYHRLKHLAGSVLHAN